MATLPTGGFLIQDLVVQMILIFSTISKHAFHSEARNISVQFWDLLKHIFKNGSSLPHI